MSEPTHGRPFYYECTVPGCILDGHKPFGERLDRAIELEARATLRTLAEKAKADDGIWGGMDRPEPDAILALLDERDALRAALTELVSSRNILRHTGDLLAEDLWDAARATLEERP